MNGFQYSQFPREAKQLFIEHFTKRCFSAKFVPHKERMWALKPGYGQANEFSYQGKPVPVIKTPGIKRILFLGDSCVNSGNDQFPEKTILKLKEQYGVVAEATIAGTASYSTFQGLRWLPDFLGYKPDALIVYFGWNDHWQDRGAGPDNMFKPLSQFDLKIKNTFRNIKVYQFMHYLIYPAQRYHPVDRDVKERLVSFLNHVRVPPVYYMANIESFISFARENNMEIYFIRPPHGEHIDKTTLYLVPPEFRKRKSVIHETYNYLLEEIVDKHKEAHLVSFKDIKFDHNLMMYDGIHPLERGHEVIAERLVSKMNETSSLILNTY